MNKTRSEKKKPSGFRRLMEYAGAHRYLTYLSWVLSFLSALIALLPFLFIFLIIKEVIESAPDLTGENPIVFYGIMAVISAVVSLLVYFGSLICSHFAAFRIGSNIRRDLLSHIIKLPLGFSDRMGSGRIRSVITDASGAAESYLAHNLPDLFSALATPLGMAALMFFIDWRFGLVTLLPVALAFLSMMKMIGPQMQNDMKEYNDALEEMNNEAVEYVRGIPVVKTFGQTVHSFSRFKASIVNYGKFCIQYTLRMRQPMLLFTLMINSTFAFLLVLALILIGGGSNITADITLNFIFYVILTPIISTTMNRLMFMMEGKMNVEDSFVRIDSLLEQKPFAEPDAQQSPKDNSVEFSHVTFSYKGSDHPALKDVSFRANSGSTIALVGSSGGGKTTVAGLISRFWDVQDGSVKIGGVNVKDISKTELMHTVSYVFQDSRLLKRSVLENVRLGRPEATETEVLDALEKAQCSDILEKLPNGIHSVIGAKGVFLSGGEMQRIAIARAILKDSPVVVLDEATAFADPENEHLVQQSFAELSKDKTVIMIAHRLTTVRNADCILVLDKGSVAEQGTHDDLLKENGIYKTMWENYQSSINWKVGEQHA